MLDYTKMPDVRRSALAGVGAVAAIAVLRRWLVPARPRVVVLGVDEAWGATDGGVGVRVENRSRRPIKSVIAWAERGDERRPADPELVIEPVPRVASGSQQVVTVDERGGRDLAGWTIYVGCEYGGWQWSTQREPDGTQRTEALSRGRGRYLLIDFGLRQPAAVSGVFRRRRWKPLVGVTGSADEPTARRAVRVRFTRMPHVTAAVARERCEYVT